MPGQSITFTHAIVRRPAASVLNGLRAVDVGAPDLAEFERHHATYVETLSETGADVIVLEPLEAFPDSVFVEDAAFCAPEGAVVMRPGAPSRLGEAALIEPHLAKVYGEVCRIDGPGFIEGGDILATETEILVGTSSRTDSAGIEAFKRLVDRWGYVVRVVDTPPGVLHFKTDCSLLDEETVLSTERLSASGCFAGYRVIYTSEDEDAAANCVRFNELVLMPFGFPRTRDRLVAAGYDVREIGNSEAEKLDGGMSCLSLRFSPRRR